MSFTKEQIEALKAPLSSAHVKKNPRGHDYVEAYHAENEANRIFGFSEWDRFTEIECISEREFEGKMRVYYRAKVRIVVRTEGGGTVTREGCGYGSGIDKDVGAAHESALKEAESDAEKRALKTFGNPFGQALYDKGKSEVSHEKPVSAAVQAAGVAIDLCGDEVTLTRWSASNAEMIAKLDPADKAEVRRRYGLRLEKLRKEATSANPFEDAA